MAQNDIIAPGEDIRRTGRVLGMAPMGPIRARGHNRDFENQPPVARRQARARLRLETGKTRVGSWFVNIFGLWDTHRLRWDKRGSRGTRPAKLKRSVGRTPTKATTSTVRNRWLGPLVAFVAASPSLFGAFERTTRAW